VTAGEPLTGSLGPSAAVDVDDTEGCLCLVAGYAKQDGLMARVTAEAQRRVMMSPALDDFLQLQYVDLGPPPGPSGDRYRPVRRIVGDLMAVQETAGRSHFALIIIAKSAVTIEDLFGSCAAEPFLARLRMRFVGIASSDDREQQNGSVDITSSPAGSWRNEKELVDALSQRCEELPRDVATRGHPGLTRVEFAALRHAHAHPGADGEGSARDVDGPQGEIVDGPQDEISASDVLDDASETDAMASDQDAAPIAAASATGRPSISAFRWSPKIPWRHGKQAAEAGDPDAATPEVPPRTAIGLVYLLIMVDQNAAADPALDRLQAAFLNLDRALAAEPLCEYRVRIIYGRDGDFRGELQDAGRLGRRAAKRLVQTGDFTAVLKVIRSSLRRDCGLVQAMATAAGLTAAAPTVVIFTADPPMADVGTAAVFGDLAADAKMVWVVPGRLEGLVSPAFGRARGATVLGEHQTVADEILEVMQGGVLTS
jgi:hypothetical protein